jgi:hypothetical protein
MAEEEKDKDLEKEVAEALKKAAETVKEGKDALAKIRGRTGASQRGNGKKNKK